MCNETYGQIPCIFYCPYCCPAQPYICPHLNHTRIGGPIKPTTPIVPIKPMTPIKDITKFPLIPVPPEERAKNTIDRKWEKLKDELGAAISGVEDLKPGYRIRYKKGAIYTQKPNGPAYAVYGEIYNYYRKMKGSKSWLGFPIMDIKSLKYDEGEVSSFEKGEIYWWPDTGAIDIDEIVLTYKGINCFRTTSGPGTDEVYASMGVVAPTGVADNPVEIATAQTRLYKGVDKGTSVPDHIQLYKGKPYGLNISFLLMEHDQGDPNKYYGAVKSSVQAGAEAVKAGIVAYGGPTVAGYAAPILKEIVPAVAKGINDLLGTGDDLIGNITIPLTAKQVIQLSSTGESIQKQIRFNLATPLLTGDGSSYKGYFTISKA